MIKIDTITRMPRTVVIKGEFLNDAVWRQDLITTAFAILSDAGCNTSEEQLRFSLNATVNPVDHQIHAFTLAGSL